MSIARRLESCSLERITRMKEVVEQEIGRIDGQVAEVEAELNEMTAKADTVSLSMRHGQYELGLDKAEAQVSKLNAAREKLQDKLRLIEQARQKRHLFDEQARVLGGTARVRIKDLVIFFLILGLVTILVVDLMGIGATGGGALASAEIVEGSIDRITILEGGAGYERVILHIADAHGSGGLATGHVTGGRLTQVDLIHRGEGYVDPVVEVLPHFSLAKLWIFWIIDVICCALFMANFIFEHRLADSKKWYWKNNWIDFITSIPLPPFQIIAASGDLGIVRLGRLLRAVRILRALRLFRIALFFWRGMDHLSTTLDVRLLKRSLLYGLLSLVFGAIIFMGVERMDSGSGFGPSLWWSFTTLVTGGYPDIHNPETAPGKILTVFLVITGMVLVGVFTATLTSILVSDEDSLKAEELEEQVGIVTKIQQEIQDTNERLARLESAVRDIGDSVRGRGNDSGA
ncbi:MAG: ion transporter [Gemmatimonadaceae bacterium]|nr:ion transporter [Gemmatimonadaceae bacterium]